MDFHASADNGPPIDQLRETLNNIFDQLRAAGGRSADFTAMHWEAAMPGAFDPSRREVDLCYREVFGGFRPPITLSPGLARLSFARRPASSREMTRSRYGVVIAWPNWNGR